MDQTAVAERILAASIKSCHKAVIEGIEIKNYIRKLMPATLFAPSKTALDKTEHTPT